MHFYECIYIVFKCIFEPVVLFFSFSFSFFTFFSESEKMEDEEAKFADESSTQIILHKPPTEEQKQDVISDQDTEKTIEETKKEKEEKKSDGMREKGELPTSSGQTGAETTSMN